MSVRPTLPVERHEFVALKRVPDRRSREGMRSHALIIILGLGLRRSELCGLRVGDLLKVDGQLCVQSSTLKRRSAAGVQRLVPVGDAEDTAALLKYARQEHGPEPDRGASLFFTRGTRYPFTKRPLTHRALDYELKRLLKRAGISRRLTSHSFRHGFGTRLLRCGTDLKTVQELLGHASIASTQVYLHSSFERKRDAVRRLADG